VRWLCVGAVKEQQKSCRRRAGKSKDPDAVPRAVSKDGRLIIRNLDVRNCSRVFNVALEC